MRDVTLKVEANCNVRTWPPGSRGSQG